MSMVPRTQELTERERKTLEHEKEMFDKNAAHVMDIERERSDVKRAEFAMRMESTRLNSEANKAIKEAQADATIMSAKYGAVADSIAAIAKIPLYVLLGVAYCIAVICRFNPPKSYWDVMNKKS